MITNQKLCRVYMFSLGYIKIVRDITFVTWLINGPTLKMTGVQNSWVQQKEINFATFQTKHTNACGKSICKIIKGIAFNEKKYSSGHIFKKRT